VEGGPGRDNLIGGDFSETFIGFGGNADSFTGGGGADRFVYGDELTNGARERFFIRDYSSAEGDVIELATDSFDVRFSGRQAVISAGEDRIYVRGDFAGVDDLTILTPDADLLS
jgi:Ca2+-binding RTX toxin-like protein